MNLSLWIWGAGVTIATILLIYWVHELVVFRDKQRRLNDSITKWLTELDPHLNAGPSIQDGTDHDIWEEEEEFFSDEGIY